MKNVVFFRRNLEAKRKSKAAKRQRTGRRCELSHLLYKPTLCGICGAT